MAPVVRPGVGDPLVPRLAVGRAAAALSLFLVEVVHDRVLEAKAPRLSLVVGPKRRRKRVGVVVVVRLFALPLLAAAILARPVLRDVGPVARPLGPLVDPPRPLDHQRG